MLTPKKHDLFHLGQFLVSHLAIVGRAWQRLSRMLQTVIIVAVTAGVAGSVGYLVISQSDGPEPTARQYLTFKACLLTGPQGVTGERDAVAWSGMQEASLKTRARVQFMPITGPATVANALPFLTSLVRLNCDMIVAADDLPARTVVEGSERFKSSRFVVIGRDEKRPNITNVNVSNDGIPAAVAESIVNAVS